MIRQMDYPAVSERRREHSQIYSRLKRASHQESTTTFSDMTGIRAGILPGDKEIKNMNRPVFELSESLKKENLITISNERNLILIKTDKLDLQVCDDCTKTTMISAQNNRHIISWCTYCADKVILGKFGNEKEILSLDVMEIQNWTDSGSSQIIETPQKNFVVQITEKQ